MLKCDVVETKRKLVYGLRIKFCPLPLPLGRGGGKVGRREGRGGLLLLWCYVQFACGST